MTPIKTHRLVLRILETIEKNQSLGYLNPIFGSDEDAEAFLGKLKKLGFLESKVDSNYAEPLIVWQLALDGERYLQLIRSLS
jgi:hypothetical protein